MGIYTRFTRRWLDERYRQTDENGVHLAHQPLFGRGAQRHTVRSDVYALARQYQILELLSHFRFDTLLDVGASEGLACHLARELFGATVFGCDLSAESCKRASEFLDVDQVACDSARLPFADGSFDAVICSEVLEHVEFPVETLLELKRVARRVLIVTSDEVRLDRAAVEAHRAPFFPHIERNHFHPDDFKAILGPRVALISQPKGRPPDEDWPDDAVATWIRDALAQSALDERAGALILDVIDPASVRAQSIDPGLILAASLRPACGRESPARRRPKLRRLLGATVCPLTRVPLIERGGAFVAGPRRYEIDDGVPMLFLDGVPDPTRENLERALSEAWPDDPDRVREVLRIRRRLEASEPTSELAWSFDELSHRGAFTPINDLVQETGDGLTLRSIGKDPSLLGPAVFYPDQGLRGFELTMAAWPHESATTTEGWAQLYWFGPFDLDFDERRSLVFPLSCDGEFRRYRIELATPPHFGQERFAFLFRLDPLDRPGRVCLRAFHFLTPAD